MLDQVFDIFTFHVIIKYQCHHHQISVSSSSNIIIIIVIIVIIIIIMIVFEGFGEHKLALRSGEDGGCDDKVDKITIISNVIITSNVIISIIITIIKI